MSLLIQPPLYTDEVDVLAGALYAWCAERDVKLSSQAGLAVASIAIDLYHSGHRTQEELLDALHANEPH